MEAFVVQLREIFPNKSEETIRSILDIIEVETPNDPEQIKFENAVNFLSETGDLLDEAAGYNVSSSTLNDEQMSVHFNNLSEVFSDCCPDYLRHLCEEKAHCFDFEEIFNQLIEGGYPKKDIDPLDTLDHLKQLLPNADPCYLEKEARVLAFKPQTELKRFVENAIESGEYPTLQDYMKNKKETDEITQYTTKFNIESFLKLIPKPIDFFSDPNRKPLLQSTANEEDNEQVTSDREYAFNVLCNLYLYHRVKTIKLILHSYNYDLIKTTDRLDRLPRALRNPRRTAKCETVCKNIPLLQELAYLQHKKQIKQVLKWKDERYQKARKEAEQYGLLEKCQCCFDEALIPEECCFCKKGCVFCKDCVKGGAETVIGNNDLDFPCLAECNSEFSIATLQMVLDSVVFSRLAQRKQMEEIKRANIEGLETCPFCDFSTIPAPEDKVFKCLNPECMKESCRECRHVSHIPKRCNEIEYDEDVRMRTYIENKMTEALLRKCVKCHKVFIKESGCNKMTCSCGASMCYLCGQAVSGYSHFRERSRCPLYTENLNRLHYEEVLRGASQAKAELGVNANPKLLKLDPTKDIQQHYNNGNNQ